ALYRTESTRQAGIQVLFHPGIPAAVPGHNASPPRHEIHQPLKAGLYLLKILIDIAVIELDGGQDHRIGKIVQELRSFIEESGVVFIAFQDELGPPAEAKT